MEIRSLGILDKSHFFQQYRFKCVLEDPVNGFSPNKKCKYFKNTIFYIIAEFH